jgi:RNA polymerase sigma-70 factor (ECF subfamily)
MILGKGKRKRKDFEKQVLSYLDLLYFVALKLTGHREDAEDLVQETYHKAFNRLDQLRDMEKCKPWLYSIMINTWKNWRAKGSREFSPDDLEQWEASINQYAGGDLQLHQTDPETDLLSKEVWIAVESALTHLPSDYRMAIILSDIEGFSYKEISEMMEWPIGTVMSRLSRARGFLRRILTECKEEKSRPRQPPELE